jgi:hypothetical protein
MLQFFKVGRMNSGQRIPGVFMIANVYLRLSDLDMIV